MRKRKAKKELKQMEKEAKDMVNLAEVMGDKIILKKALETLEEIRLLKVRVEKGER